MLITNRGIYNLVFMNRLFISFYSQQLGSHINIDNCDVPNINWLKSRSRMIRDIFQWNNSVLFNLLDFFVFPFLFFF